MELYVLFSFNKCFISHYYLYYFIHIFVKSEYHSVECFILLFYVILKVNLT